MDKTELTELAAQRRSRRVGADVGQTAELMGGRASNGATESLTNGPTGTRHSRQPVARRLHPAVTSMAAVLWLLWTLLVVLAGCSDSGDKAAVSTVAPSDAKSVMTDMIATYRGAKTYRDSAYVSLRYRRDGQAYEDRAPVAVAWQAPNRIAIDAYEIKIASDGRRLRARIRDKGTRDFDGQFVARPMAKRLSLDMLYKVDQVMGVALRQGLVGYPLQLDLLLAERPLAPLMDMDAATHTLLAPEKIDGTLCDRVQIKTVDGTFTLWVDRNAHLLRRAEYPVKTFAARVVEDPTVSDAALTVEFSGARIAPPLADAVFALAVPAGAKVVREFIPPPQELSSDLFGKQIQAFAFRDLSGEVVTSKSLGRTVKILAWFNDHPACKATLQQLNEVYAQYRTRSDFRFVAVSAIPSSTSDAELRSLLDMWQVSVPVVRDTEAYGRDLFHIPWAPTLIVLDADNKLHIFEVGANDKLTTELPQVLQRLAAGEDVAAKILATFRDARLRYQRALEHGAPEREETQAVSARRQAPVQTR